MRLTARTLGRLVVTLTLAIFVPASYAADRQRVQADSYIIQAVVTPETHQLKAVAQVKFTALDDISVASFQLQNGLRPTRVIDADGQTLSAERISQDATVRVSLPAGLSKGASSTLIFEYEGTVQSADDSVVPGLKLAYVGDPETYLLYAGAWFPMVGYGTNRFTSTIGVSAPTGYTVIGSGKETMGSMPPIGEDIEPGRATVKKAAARSGPGKLAIPAGYTTQTFTYAKASFPGTILIGKYVQTKSIGGRAGRHGLHHREEQRVCASLCGHGVEGVFLLHVELWTAFSTKLSVVEIPNDTVPEAWAPEICGD